MVGQEPPHPTTSTGRMMPNHPEATSRRSPRPPHEDAKPGNLTGQFGTRRVSSSKKFCTRLTERVPRWSERAIKKRRSSEEMSQKSISSQPNVGRCGEQCLQPNGPKPRRLDRVAACEGGIQAGEGVGHGRQDASDASEGASVSHAYETTPRARFTPARDSRSRPLPARRTRPDRRPPASSRLRACGRPPCRPPPRALR